jgi:TolB-like protein/class 3 adenylate cyclase
MQRKLTAILSADVVGYSGLMEVDETGTLERLKLNRSSIFDPHVAAHGGRVFKLIGDGAMVEFPSVVEAVNCALAIQEAMARSEPGHREENRIRYRIGINLGDVIVDDDDIYGDGVNVAARLQALSPIGGIAVSSTVRDQTQGKTNCVFEDMGKHKVKNIDRPVHVFSVAVQSKSDVGERNVRARPRLSAARKRSQDAKLAPPDNKPSIAVMPFANLSNDPEQEYFSDGMTDEIVSALTRNRLLFVIASSSTRSLKGKSVAPQDVGRQLGVRYLLQGSVQKSGPRVRISVNLIDAANGSQLWSGKFDDTLEDVFKLQDRVALEAASVVGGAVETSETRKALHRPTENMGAYDLYLRGFALFLEFRKNEMSEALVLFERALALDSEFAIAAALSAVCHSQMVSNGWTNEPATHRDASLKLAERAVRAGPEDARVLAQAASALSAFGRINIALAHITHAAELDPGSALVWYISGVIHARLGHAEVAVENLERSIRLDPLAGLGPAHAWIAIARFSQGRNDEALKFLDETTYRNPLVYAFKSAILAANGNMESASTALATLKSISAAPIESFAAVYLTDANKTLFRDAVATLVRH